MVTLPEMVPPFRVADELALFPRLRLPVMVPAVRVRSKSPEVVVRLPVMLPALLVIARLPEVEVILPVMVPEVLVMVALAVVEEIAEVMVAPFRFRVDPPARVRLVAVMLFDPAVRVLLAFTATVSRELVAPKLLLREKLSAMVTVPTAALAPFIVPLIDPLFTVRLELAPRVMFPVTEAVPLRVVVELAARVRVVVKVLVVARFRAPVTEVVVAVIDSLAFKVAPLLIVNEVIAVDPPIIPLVVAVLSAATIN
jgi:hypothetical protein